MGQMEPVSDEVILGAVLGGNTERFGVLFDRHGRRILAYARRHVAGQLEAEDIVAVVFLEAWRARAKIRVVDGSILPWLLVTANNVLRNGHRAHRRYAALLERLPLASSEPDHAEATADRHAAEDHRRDLAAAFARLAPRDQDVLTLCVLEGLSMIQAGAVLGIPVPTVKTRLARAKGRLAGMVPHLNPSAGQTVKGLSYGNN
jgi:RNA polymerase sigma-70 factor (ECF subfamily)